MCSGKQSTEIQGRKAKAQSMDINTLSQIVKLNLAM